MTALPAALLVAALAWPSVREPLPVTPSEVPAQQVQQTRAPVAGAPARAVRTPPARTRTVVPTPVAAVTAPPPSASPSPAPQPTRTRAAEPDPSPSGGGCVVALLEPLGC